MRVKTKICMGCLRQIGLQDNICPYCGFDPLQVQNSRYLRVGTRLAKRYIVGKELGEGGFGITYTGYDTVKKQPVAIKEYFPAGIAGRDTSIGRNQDVRPFDGKNGELYHEGLERFKKEGNAMGKVDDFVHVVNVYDYLEENNTGYIIMEYVPGITIHQKVKRDGAFSLAEMFEVLKPLMQDLQKIHEMGMLHRDISPDNIIIRPDGVAKLIDFGSARMVETREAGLQQTMTVMVRQQYAPKEQYLRKGNQGPWSDIYALCATCFFMLTGEAPISALERENEDAQKTLEECKPELGEEISQIIKKGMALQIKERYTELKELIYDLEQVIPLKAKHSVIDRTLYVDREKEKRRIILPLWKRKKRRILLGIVGIFLILSVCISLYMGNWWKEEEMATKEMPQPTAVVTPESTATKSLQITMPRLKELSQESACNLIKQTDSDLVIHIEKNYHDKVKKGRVIRQSIAPGTIYEDGTYQEITLEISRGARKVMVPDVIGFKKQDGINLLKKQGLRIECIQEYSSTVPEGQVIRQSKKGKKVKEKTVITLTISLGKKPQATQKPEQERTKEPQDNGIRIIT